MSRFLTLIILFVFPKLGNVTFTIVFSMSLTINNVRTKNRSASYGNCSIITQRTEKLIVTNVPDLVYIIIQQKVQTKIDGIFIINVFLLTSQIVSIFKIIPQVPV